MSDPVELYQLQPSFNSRKVRYALGFKGVPYKAINVGDGEAAKVIAISGQPMTPVLKHGAVVMFDSGAIVRYIDANIPGPRMFSAKVEEMRAIEQWESRSRVELLAPYMKVAGLVKSGNIQGPEIQDAKALFIAGARLIQDALNEDGVLVGSGLGAADIFCGCYLAYGFLTSAQAGTRPPMVWSMENMNLAREPGMSKLTTWFERLRPLDGI